MVELNKVSGFIQYLSFIVCWGFIIGSSILVILTSLIFPTSFEVFIYFCLFIVTILALKYVFIELIVKIIYKVSKNNIVLEKNHMQYKGTRYLDKNIKLFYWKFNLRNLFDYDANRLLVSIDGEGVELGRYPYRKIKKILQESNIEILF